MKTLTSNSWRVQAGSFLREVLRDPAVILWNILWPIILCALYLIAFSGFGHWQLEPIHLAIHEDSRAKTVFEQVAKEAQAGQGEEGVVDNINLQVVSVASDAEGKSLLYKMNLTEGSDGPATHPDASSANSTKDSRDAASTTGASADTDGANNSADDVSVSATANQPTQTVLAYIDADDRLYYPTKMARKPELQIVTSLLDSYVPLKGIIDDAIQEGLPLAKIPELIKGGPEISSLRPQKMDASPMILSYLNLFSMCSITGCFSTQGYLYYIQADQSAIGMRVATSPRKKSRFLGISFLMGLGVVLFSLLLLMVFMHYTVGLDLLSHFWSNLYLFFISSSAMLCLGFFIGTLPLSVEAKSGICLGFTLLLPFLAGMMSPDLAFLFRAKAPLLLDLNPAYQLANEIIRINRLGLPMRVRFLTLFFLIFAALFFGLALIQLRRQKFKSLALG